MDPALVGVIGGVVGSCLTIVTQFFLNWRKQASADSLAVEKQSDAHELAMLPLILARLREVEKSHDDCQKAQIALAAEMGELREQISVLKDENAEQAEKIERLEAK